MMRRLLGRLKNLLFPPKCMFCGAIIDASRDELCGDCRRSIPWAGTGLVPGGFHEGTVSALRYEGNARDAVLRFKFSGCHWFADVFGELLADIVKMTLEGRFDIITWVPISKKRLRRRTYDQSELLAGVVGKQLGLPVTRTLKKTKHTKANSSLGDEKARQSNVAGAYEVLEGVENKRILLIDDILTTGSTLSECAKTLMLGGADSVVCATLARAERKK